MNIRFSNKEIRFRITTEECRKLLGGDIIECRNILSFRIAPDLEAASLSLENGPGELLLKVSRRRLEELLATLPNADGLQDENGRVVLEVDLKS
jgi:hypothetical protein